MSTSSEHGHGLNRGYSARERRLAARPRSRRLIGSIIALALVALLAWAGANRLAKNGSSTSVLSVGTSASPSPSPTKLASVALATPTPAPAPTKAPAPIGSTITLQAAIQRQIDAHPELIIGVSFTDITSGSHVDVHGETVFTAASTAKMLVACDFLQEVEQGEHSLDELLDTRTASYHLKQMINQSNNDSWALFNTLLTDPGEESYAKQIGMTYNADSNQLTANGMATLLSKLYSGKLLNKEHTDLLLSYMQDTNEESLIPGALPSSYTFYHKYGEYEDNVHDVAIINDGTHTYALAIYTNGKGFYAYDKRTQTIHDIVNSVIKALKA